MSARVIRMPSAAEHLARRAAPWADACVSMMASRICGYAVLALGDEGADVWVRRSPEQCLEAAGALSDTGFGPAGAAPAAAPGQRVLVIAPRLRAWVTLEQLATAGAA